MTSFENIAININNDAITIDNIIIDCQHFQNELDIFSQ